MNCKRIRKYLMTDYFDKEASAVLQGKIEAHLSYCSKCRKFEKSVREGLGSAFKDIYHEAPPEGLWGRIKDEIESESVRKEQFFFEHLLVSLREFFTVRRRAYAFATALTLILAVTVFSQSPFRRQMIVKDYLSNKTAFMVAMNGPLNGDLDKTVNFNTAIEEYLF